MTIWQPPTIWTIGHDDQDVDALCESLLRMDISTLVDIRTHPHSKRSPQFDEPKLRRVLGDKGLNYHWAGKAFGGWRPAVLNSKHPALANSATAQGFADYMGTAFFQKSATQLIQLARKSNTVLMGVEKDYRQCHRRLLSDYLVLAGLEILHVTDTGALVAHALSPEARRESSEVVYDRRTDAPPAI